jgi:hypothetical protein
MRLFSARPIPALLLVLALAACTTVDENITRTTETVTAITVGEATEVSALDLAQAMLKAGFTREQILQHGAAVRNALAKSGGAQVRDGKMVGALFSIHSGQLYVTSRSRGTFMQPLSPHVVTGG